MKKTFSQQECDELKKSLATLNLSDEEIEAYIEKAQKGSDDPEEKEEGTIADQAEGGGTKDDDEGGASDEGGEKKEQTEQEKLEKACANLKMKKGQIEKAIADLEEKMGKKPTIEKSLNDDIAKSLDERFEEIEKSLSDKFSEIIDKQTEIIKGLQEDLEKIGSTPIATKAVVTSANFFEKGIENDLETTELSISKNRDELLKGMQDLLNDETDGTTRQLLTDGISDFTINSIPTTHGIRALAYLSRKKNITLGQ